MPFCQLSTTVAKKNKGKTKEEATKRRGVRVRDFGAALLCSGDTSQQRDTAGQVEDPVESDSSSFHNTDFYEPDSDESGPECLTCPCTPAVKKRQQAGTPSPPPYTSSSPTPMDSTVATPSHVPAAAPIAPGHFGWLVGFPSPTPGPSRLPYRHEISSPVTASPKKHVKKWSAYVVYKGRSTGVFKRWGEVKPIVKGDSEAVYKGFPSLSLAQTSYELVSTWGLIDIMNAPTASPIPLYAVIEGVAPGVYYGHHQMLRDGLFWASGVVQQFTDVTSANALFVQSYMEGRVVVLQSIFDLA
ncbi:hypothetical protein K435DRAFT_855101 [Dendrothele bispora CBS 962.96]|uniref:Ribonuclease H1 N-terminal domain-containing protein n=1 Tax=Dendrothele bispora (strain CBS 962.96) TaxID=1314807 RepID=A0A4S8MC23_DENBC|nr:hypothetical protein K435DRAFT_855101 [Dendrothele bispora CBS 962.96]